MTDAYFSLNVLMYWSIFDQKRGFLGAQMYSRWADLCVVQDPAAARLAADFGLVGLVFLLLFGKIK